MAGDINDAPHQPEVTQQDRDRRLGLIAIVDAIRLAARPALLIAEPEAGELLTALRDQLALCPELRNGPVSPVSEHRLQLLLRRADQWLRSNASTSLEVWRPFRDRPGVNLDVIVVRLAEYLVVRRRRNVLPIGAEPRR